MSKNENETKELPKLSVVFATREQNEKTEKYIEHIQKTAGCQVNVFVLVNPNGVALTQIYGSVLNNEGIPSDIVVFMHDDIEFLRSGWATELLRLFEENKEYGIIGVAGSAQFDENGAWWQYEKKYGQVLHRKDGKSWLTTFSPLLDKDLQEVCVVDGLFVAIHQKRIIETFDEKIAGFNFYEIDFCLANYLTRKCKIGVTTNIRLAHNSVGELKPEWYTNRDYINQKYGDKFPIDVEAQNAKKNNRKTGKKGKGKKK